MKCPFDPSCPAWAENKKSCFYYAYYHGKSKTGKKGVCPKEVHDAAHKQVRSASTFSELVG